MLKFHRKRIDNKIEFKSYYMDDRKLSLDDGGIACEKLRARSNTEPGNKSKPGLFKETDDG